MRLGLSSFACAWEVGVAGYPVPEPMNGVDFVHRTASYGLTVAQLADNLRFERYSTRQLTELRDSARALEVTIELATRGIEPAHLAHVVRIAQFLESPLLRVVTDTADHKPSIDQIIEAIRVLAPKLKESGLLLALENHDRLTASELANIIEQVDSPAVGICLDTVNSFGALEGPRHVVSILARHTLSLHLKDFTIARKPHNMGFEISGTPAGEGKLNVPWLLEELRSAGRNPNVILELWPAPEPDIQTTIRKERLWRESSIRYLRTLIPN